MRRGGVAITTAVLCCAALLQPGPRGDTAAPERPNVILILTDTLRPDYLGCYGFEGDVSPNLDALAGEAVRFTSVFSAAPWTKPAVASIFTSLDPRTHRVLDHEGKFWIKTGGDLKTTALPESAVTLAEVLAAAGYRTGAWVANGWITKGLGFAQGFGEFHSAKLDTNVYDAAKIWEPAWSWIAKVKDGHRPFFVYLHLMDVHGPWRWSPEDYEAVRKSPSLPANLPDKLLAKHFKPLQSRDIDFPGFDTTIPSWRAVYASRVRSLDRQMGRLFAKLRAAGLLDSTVILFTADHGEQLGERSGWGHGSSLHQNQIHIPLIIRPPGGIEEGRSVDGVASSLDIMPTILEAAGITRAPKGMQGTSLWRTVVSGSPLPHPEWAFSTGVRQDAGIESVRSGRYELIRYGSFDPPSYELYDLLVDPGESKNLVPRRPEVLSRLRDGLDRHGAELARTPTLLKSSSPVSPEEIEKLKSLGYID
ncbi:MAG TPA: sulfatase [Candidatus Saccharimonadales bacterium]|nr:sulfatase [Candidatus Saccharimonadales bacterium]